VSLAAASLFAGIGGFDLAAEALGASVVLQAEIDPSAQNVLRTHFPNVSLVDDAANVDLRGVDLVMAGFPCQGLSAAASTPGGRGLFDPSSPSAVVWTALTRVFWARPEYLLLENADSLATAQYAADMQALVSLLAENGYYAHTVSLNAGCFGSMMRRVRTFVLARRRPWPRPHVEKRVTWTCMPSAIGVSNQQGGALFCAQPSVTKKASTYTLFVTRDEVRSVTPDGVEVLFGYPVGWTAPAGRKGARYARLGNTVSIHAARASLDLLLNGVTATSTPASDYAALETFTVPAPGGTAGSAFGRITRTTLGSRNANTNMIELTYCVPVYAAWMHAHPDDVSPAMWDYLALAESHSLVRPPQPWPDEVEVVMEQRG
jgi:DNA (cytosine-5)-methyltransferase 1